MAPSTNRCLSHKEKPPDPELKQIRNVHTPGGRGRAQVWVSGRAHAYQDAQGPGFLSPAPPLNFFFKKKVRKKETYKPHSDQLFRAQAQFTGYKEDRGAR